MFLHVVLEKTLESSLDNKDIKPVHTKGNQPWICIGKTDAETEAPILWPPDPKSRLIGKDPHARKGWRQEEKGVTEDEMVGCIIDLVNMNLSKCWEIVKDREAWRAAVHEVAKSQTRPSDWITTTSWFYNNVKHTHCSMDEEFQFCKMKNLWRSIVQQCGHT